ncbi:hypothetical protein RD792_000318 [Penstemon davidsonii]|uniref:CCHC-type domain-containing protein n=1 Tax=Penstemon davidsonii TaxID=160366 RepID=A0ABR0DL34_9LAMI|nr:hypothetical protein RD792_000318 [Penstemon davidsonii]
MALGIGSCKEAIESQSKYANNEISLMKAENGCTLIKSTTTRGVIKHGINGVHDLLQCPICANSMYPPIHQDKSAKKFLEEIEQYFAKNEKSEASNLLGKLVSMKYKSNGNIREYIMEISNLASKLKSLKLELSDDLLVHVVLISLPTHFGQFKVSYNTQKDKWSLNELISHCVQEEERQQRDKIESAHLASTFQNKKMKKVDVTAKGSSLQKKLKKQDKSITCYFCEKLGHKKSECPKYAKYVIWRANRGLIVEPIAE